MSRNRQNEEENEPLVRPASEALPPGAFSIEECAAGAVAPLRSLWISEGNWAPEKCVDNLDKEATRHFIILDADREPVGCASIADDTKEVAGVIAHKRLRWLGVAPYARRQGIGRALVGHRLWIAKQAGENSAWTDAMLNRAELYAKWGAKPGGEIYDNDGSGPHMDMLYGPLQH